MQSPTLSMRGVSTLYSVSSCHLWCCRPRLPPLWDVCRLKSTSVGSPPSGDAVPMPLMVPDVLLRLLLSSSVSFEMRGYQPPCAILDGFIPKTRSCENSLGSKLLRALLPMGRTTWGAWQKGVGKKWSEADSWLGKLRSRALKFSQIARRSSSSLLDQRPSCLQQKCQQQQQLRQLE